MSRPVLSERSPNKPGLEATAGVRHSARALAFMAPETPPPVSFPSQLDKPNQPARLVLVRQGEKIENLYVKASATATVGKYDAIKNITGISI